MEPSQIQKLVIPLLLTSLVLPSICNCLHTRLDLKHSNAGSGSTKFELLKRAAVRANNRAARLFRANTRAPKIPVEPHEGEYLIELSLGTPSQGVILTLDTGSDLIWTQCQPCLFCFNQTFPLYDPSVSSTYHKIRCSSKFCNALSNSACHQECLYGYSYEDNSTTFGILSSDTFTFGSPIDSVPNIAFGCGILNQGVFMNESGIAGFGRGDLSLISQLGVTKFSYCLTSFDHNKTSPLFMGSLAELEGPVQSTHILTNKNTPSLYYLSLMGITVGKKRIKFPKSAFALKKNGSGGVIIDTGTAITRLARVAFQSVKKEFVKQMNLNPGRDKTDSFDLCFALPDYNTSYSDSDYKIEVPGLVFHFDGADMELPKENYMHSDVDTGLMCLLILESDDLTIIGNIQQQGMKVLYDLEKNKLSFVRARCDQL